MHSSRSAIILFADPLMSAPTENFLAAALTPEERRQLHEALLARTAAVVAEPELSSLERSVFLGTTLEQAYRMALGLKIPNCFSVESQYGNSLAERLEHALEKKFNDGFQKVAIVGSGCPFVSAGQIQRALALLSDHDVVAGPTTSGGYYLAGFSAFVPAILRGIHWEAAPLQRQLEELMALHSLHGSFLEPLNGLENIESLAALASQPSRDPAWTQLPGNVQLSSIAGQILERKKTNQP